MRKAIYISLCFLLAIAMILPCSALSMTPLPTHDYKGYLNYVNKHRLIGDLPQSFIHYEQIAILGTFIDFKEVYRDGPRFKLQDSSGAEILFRCHIGTNRFSIINTVTYVPKEGWTEPQEISLDMVKDITCMTHLKPPVYPYMHACVTVGDLTYYYHNFSTHYENWDPNNRFAGIFWNYKGNTYSIMADDYPTGQDTLVGRLLNYDTAEAALEELTTFMDANAGAENGVLLLELLKPVAIVLCCCGIVFAAIVLLKRRKKARPAHDPDLVPDTAPKTPKNRDARRLD